MNPDQPDTISAQIDAARKSADEWPAWMKSTAYFSEARVKENNAQSPKQVGSHETAQKTS